MLTDFTANLVDGLDRRGVYAIGDVSCDEVSGVVVPLRGGGCVVVVQDVEVGLVDVELWGERGVVLSSESVWLGGSGVVDGVLSIVLSYVGDRYVSEDVFVSDEGVAAPALFAKRVITGV